MHALTLKQQDAQTPPTATEPLPTLSSLRSAALLAKAATLSWVDLTNRVAWPTGLTDAMLRSLRPKVEAMLNPATKIQAAEAKTLLLSFYQQTDAGDAINDAQNKIWLHHLCQLPNDIIRAAVIKWTGENRPFTPRVPGELLAIATPIYKARLYRLVLIDHLLSVPVEPKIEVTEEGKRAFTDALAILAKPKPAPIDPLQRAREEKTGAMVEDLKQAAATEQRP